MGIAFGFDSSAFAVDKLNSSADHVIWFPKESIPVPFQLFPLLNPLNLTALAGRGVAAFAPTPIPGRPAIPILRCIGAKLILTVLPS